MTDLHFKTVAEQVDNLLRQIENLDEIEVDGKWEQLWTQKDVALANIYRYNIMRLLKEKGV